MHKGSRPFRFSNHWFRRLFAHQSLQHQLMLMTILIVVVSILLVGIVTYHQASLMVKNQAAVQTSQQLHQSSLNLERYYSEIREMATFIISDDQIQTYLNSTDESMKNGFDEVFRTLSYFQNTKRGFSYIYIHKPLTDRIVYVGPSKSGRAVDEQLRQILPNGAATVSKGIQRIGPLPDLIETGQYVFMFSQPINDLYWVDKQVGTLGISVSEQALAEQYQSSEGAFEMTYLIVDNNMTILSHRDKSLIGKRADIGQAFLNDRGSFEQGDQLLVYEYARDWDFYLVGIIPLEILLRDNRILILEVMIVISAAVALAILMVLLFSRQLTRPFCELTERMNRVANGDWDQTIDLSQYGDEYATVSAGFNTMTTRIRQLLHQIVREERQLQEIELKALHAQIKPHFLYNTLDSIHWLAAVNHQEEISTIVKALAGFYRICLSQGSDMLPLSTELEQVEHYLVIQRIRYSDLFDFEKKIPAELMTFMIPKMTLQPLVENAIYHGLRGRGQHGWIHIEASDEGDFVDINVSDNGVGVDEVKIEALNHLEASEPGTGSYGLKNVHQRLKLTYGPDSGLLFAQNSAGGLTVTVRIPKEGGGISRVFDTDR
jgi:two-component system sensor histidine kinase YesM